MTHPCLKLAVVLMAMAGSTATAQMQHHGNMANQPYAGQQQRSITSLSADDQLALRAGQGWGLAKPAELNGVPGPLHLLERTLGLEPIAGGKP